ncbi:protein kinase domain-containing protein [Kitasatospora sp. NPDC004240]
MSEQGNSAVEGYSLGNGRYVLQRLLGEGGMASVHLAYDNVLGRQVALKTLHTELGREASFKERFRREAQAVARLEHENIVRVYDTGEDVAADGSTTPYIVMQLVDGKGLREALNEAVAEHGAMPTAEALRVTIGVLAALEASHDQGLVHRDIKPGNVMFDRKGTVKVMDFGIARALESGVTSMTQTGMVVGTPQYLSPEQALGKPVDARSDLYTVGVMLFELLTGRLVFDGDSAFSIAYKHVQEEAVPPSTINRSVGQAMDAFVAKALRKDPAHRFQSAAEMREEAERLLAVEKGEGQARANTPLVIAEGPRAATAAPQAPQTPQPFPQQQPFQTPPPAYRTPPPTPQPFPQPQPQFQTPPPAFPTPTPFAPQQHTPVPQPMPMPMPMPMPQQFKPAPAPASGNGCGTAMVIVGIVIGVIVLVIIIIAIVATKANAQTTDGTGRAADRPATVLHLDAPADRNDLL